jgi:P-type Cu+ transporter
MNTPAPDRAQSRVLPVGAACGECACDAGVPSSTPRSQPFRRDASSSAGFGRQALTLLAVLFGIVLVVVVLGEWFGLFETVTGRVPWFVWLASILAGGYPVFRGVARSAVRGRITSHTLMTAGVLAAIAVQQWPTAAVVVVFMRVGDYVEVFTTRRARRAIRSLMEMAPRTARVERGGGEHEVPIDAVAIGEIVVVRPGEQIPVDGEVVGGHAAVDQASITGEAMPAEVGVGARVFAASVASLGSLRVRAARVGRDTTFGRVVSMVEDAEAHRANIQRVADKFSAAYLPVVAGVAGLTLLLRHDPLATAAVLVVACSCSFALATPIAVLASIGAAARRGVLVKGGRALEALAGADVLLIDKTGTLTLGRPQVTEIRPLNGVAPREVLALAAAAERYSEHPLAEAVRAAAEAQDVRAGVPEWFEALPGLGVRARVDGVLVTVGSARAVPQTGRVAADLEAQGNTLLYVSRDGDVIGVLAVADTPRSEVPAALQAIKALGFAEIEVLTGDHERSARALAEKLNIRYRAQLLPEDKIAIVRDYQARGHAVVMVGDGVNDAPALAQADVGIAMGVAGSDVAVEAAHVALLRDDWTLIPKTVALARRTRRVVQGNLLFTAVYNLVGLSLASVGLLPPVLAAAAQSLPDLGILANSSRLLRTRL